METKIKVLVVSGWLFLFFSVIISIPRLANAENGARPLSTASQGDDIPLIDENTEQKIDEAHDYYSQLLLEAVNYVDYFFDDKRYKAEANTTRLNLRLDLAYMDQRTMTEFSNSRWYYFKGWVHNHPDQWHRY